MDNINDKMISELTAKIAQIKANAEISKLKAIIVELKYQAKIELKEKNDLIKELSKLKSAEITQNKNIGNQITKLNDEYINRVRFSKRYKLNEKNKTESIELVILFRGVKKVRHQQIIITKYNNESYEILSSKEFACDSLYDLKKIEEYLIEINTEKQTTRCINWLINKLEII